jgi:hypothetical protein
MLRGLLHEIVRRRLWPIPVVALLIAVAAPLLFLKSTPSSAPVPAEAAQAPVGGVGLPVRAQRLLQTQSDAAKRKAKKRAKADDPFEGPKSTGNAADDASSSDAGGAGSGSSSAGGAGAEEPVPVVITDENGRTVSAPDDASAPAGARSSGSDPSYVAVDVRFEPKSTGPVRHAIPRLKAFSANDRVLAIFVRYSPSSNRAVFAVAPNTWVRGSVACRPAAGLCRTVQLAAGKHAVLTILGPHRTAITRRLSVVRIRLVKGTEPRPPLNGPCLLGKLKKLGLGDAALLSGACG